MSARQKAIVAVIIAHIIWGASTPIIKLALGSIPPFGFAVLRFWLTSIILLPICLIRKESLLIKKSDVLVVLASCAFLVPINIGLYFAGTALTTAIDAAVISGLVPILTALAAFLFLREKLGKSTAIGILIAFFGSLIVIGEPVLTFGGHDGVRALGNILNFLSALAWVAGTLLLKRFNHRYSPLAITTLAFILGIFMLLPFAWVEFIKDPSWIRSLEGPAYFGIAYVVLGNSIAAYTLYSFALKYISATNANSASYIMPVVSVLIAVPLLHEVLTLPFIIGGIIIAIGVFLAENSQRKKRSKLSSV